MIVVTGRIESTDELRERLVRAARTMCEASRGDAGCRGYRFYEDTEQPNRFLFLEEWDSDEDLQSHFAQPHTGEFMAAIADLMSGRPDVLFHTIATTRTLGRDGLVEVE